MYEYEFNGKVLIPTPIGEVDLNGINGINVKSFGVKGNGIEDDTIMLKKIFDGGHKNIFFPKGVYKICLNEGETLGNFVNTDNIKIIGQDAVIYDVKKDYTNNGAITTMFKFDNCNNIDIDIDFEGIPLLSPNDDLGYKGATFSYFTNNCDGIKVKGTHKNLRYSVLSGNYSFPNLGYCKNFDLNLKTDFSGYTIALYLAENIDVNIEATNTHRAVYLAGVSNGNLNVKFKNQYIAPIQVLVTDAKVSDGVSKGCSNLNIKAVDQGSEVFPTNGSFCCGISLSRVDPYTKFENLDFFINVVGNDIVSSKVGGFFIGSNVKLTLPEYTHNWVNTIELKNIKVSGLIDKSGQTVSNGLNGDFYVSTAEDQTYGAKVSNFNIENLIVLSPPTPISPLVFNFSNLQNNVNFKNLIVKGVDVSVNSNLISLITIEKSTIENFIVYGKYHFIDSFVDNISDTGNNGSFLNSSIQKSKVSFKLLKKEITLNGSNSITFQNAIPSGALLIDVHTLVLEQVTGNANFNVGISGQLNLFAWGVPITVGGSFTSRAGNNTGLNPKIYQTSTNILVNATNPFTGGKVLIMVWYIELIPPKL